MARLTIVVYDPREDFEVVGVRGAPPRFYSETALLEYIAGLDGQRPRREEEIEFRYRNVVPRDFRSGFESRLRDHIFKLNRSGIDNE